MKSLCRAAGAHTRAHTLTTTQGVPAAISIIISASLGKRLGENNIMRAN